MSPSGAEGDLFHIIALSDLSRSEQIRVEKTVHEVNEKAAIIGVGVTPRSWDLRPVIVLGRESEPSMIRFLGPEVTLCPVYQARMKELLQRLSSFKDLESNAKLVEWGTFEGQLWYRRELVDETLESAKKPQSFSETLRLARQLVSSVESFHSRGVIHGHIVTGNIVLGDTVALLDPGVGVCVLQSLQKLGIEEFPKGYEKSSFAPELVSGGELLYGSDIYGLGVVLRDLFETFRERFPDTSHASKSNGNHSRLLTLSELIDSMCAPDATLRPSLKQVTLALGAHGGDVSSQAPGKVQHRTTDRPLRLGPSEKGKVIQPTPRSSNSSSDSGSGMQKAAAPMRNPSLTPPLPPSSAPSSAPSLTPASSPPSTSSSMAEVRNGLQNLPQSNRERREDPKPSIPTQPTTPAWDSSSLPFDAEPLPGPTSAPLPANTEFLNSPAQISVPNRMSNITFGMLIFACCVVLGMILYRVAFQPSSLDREELEIAWQSNRPSLMAKVANIALEHSASSEFAESLILGTILAGEELPVSVNRNLLLIALHERWEQELDREDRRTALALALSGSLLDRLPTDLKPLAEAHPGLILAITATAGEEAINTLNQVPVSVLGNLPPPYGLAFRILAEKNLGCGAESVRQLARLVADGTLSSEGIIKFLSTNTTNHLRAMAYFVSQENQKARRILDTLLNHPNLTLQHEAIAWGRNWDLLGWNELEASEQLFVLAGIPPTAEVKSENVAKLFAHPYAAMRKFAVKQAFDRISFQHPASQQVLRQLEANPELVSPANMLRLAQMLEKPDTADVATIRAFLADAPPLELVSSMLEATSENKQASRVDFEFSRYLQRKNWVPTVTQLRKLVSHPDSMTRLYAYTNTFELEDTETAKRILTEAHTKELNPDYKDQVAEMIHQLTNGDEL